MLFNKRLEHIINTDPELAENSDIDNNNIMVILMISYFFKTFKLVVIILTVSYFMGMFWYIYCDLTSASDYKIFEDDSISQEERDALRLEAGFIHYFRLNQNTDYENAVIVTYYAFTTLSTVGFGDFHPRSDAERSLCAIILLVGVAIFSYIMGNFIQILVSL